MKKVIIRSDVPKGYWYSNMQGAKFNVFYTSTNCVHVLSYGLVKEIEANHCDEYIEKDDRQYPIIQTECIKLDKHYDNSNGSIYKFCADHNLNAYEFDIIKRVVRCRKKGNFKDDLEKTKRVIDLYLNEQQ
jgi:hypothetical protein